MSVSEFHVPNFVFRYLNCRLEDLNSRSTTIRCIFKSRGVRASHVDVKASPLDTVDVLLDRILEALVEEDYDISIMDRANLLIGFDRLTEEELGFFHGDTALKYLVAFERDCTVICLIRRRVSTGI
ncbi:hypothetical protein BGZ82_008639 [Podila clonocystis]|nr:hypothetical protein BGZ82_008639 [Podila clonocystis]